jgi:hypothetical protein
MSACQFLPLAFCCSEHSLTGIAHQGGTSLETRTVELAVQVLGIGIVSTRI